MKMRIFLLILLFSILLSRTKAQVVFCPPGAEWNNVFYGMNKPETFLVSIKYIRDSAIGPEIVKVLQNNCFYKECNQASPIIPSITLIKQKGDTIFFRNSKTQDTWQVLFNFAAQSGQTWQTTYLKWDSTPVTVTYTVDSVTYININGFNLKRLYVFGKSPHGVKLLYCITERLGWETFLFNYYSYKIPCHADVFFKFLCYRDSTFGLKEFTEYGCDYSNQVGVDELKTESDAMKVFPNPYSKKINITSESVIKYIEIADLLGRCLRSYPVNDKSVELEEELQGKGLLFFRIVTEIGTVVKKVVNE